MLKYIFVVALLLTTMACTSLRSAYYDGWESSPALPSEQRYYWLRLADLYLSLTPEQARQRLKEVGSGHKTDLQWYRYALLNQQLDERAGWVRARDAFRHLKSTEQLSQEVRGLIRLLLRYNQNMINWDERYNRLDARLAELHTQLADSQAQQQLLEEKIEAITNLEQSISSRKEQVKEPDTEQQAP